MKFPRSRAEHLAEYLRGSIERGELSDPLPNSRAWSVKLGVSRPTLIAALHELQRQGYVSIRARGGVTLRSLPRKSATAPANLQRVVRILYYGRDYPNVSPDLEMFFQFAEAVQPEGIHVRIEKCDDARLRAISEKGEQSNELIMLLSMPARHQELFAKWKRAALMIGKPAPGIDLPFIRFDVGTAIRHATLTLLQHGFTTINLVTNRSGAVAIQQSVEQFRATCAEWEHQPIQARVLWVPLQLEPLIMTFRRFVGHIREPQGIIVARSVHIGVILGVLMGGGIGIPNQVELCAVGTDPETANACPSVSHYPQPFGQFCKALSAATLRYFDTGTLPQVHKTLVAERVRALR